MPERYKGPEKKEVNRQKLMPSRREIGRVLKSGPANKLRQQTNLLKLKGINQLKNTPGPKEQVTTIVKLAENLKNRVAKQVRGKLNGELNKKQSDLLNMRFRLPNQQSSRESQKGKVVLKLKGLGVGVKYSKGGSNIEVAIKKGPDKRTPVDAKVKANIRIPGQENTTLHLRYDHKLKRFSVSGDYTLANAGKLLGKKAQLNVNANVAVSPKESNYSTSVTYGNDKLKLEARTDLTYQRGRVSYQVVGGVSARF